MNIFFPEPDIEVGKDGFERKCDLGRAESGKKLSELVEKISEPVVIAVDGPWGSGKSHFLKLWTGAHTLENDGSAKVIYFDAFKHDYFDDPLVALVGQILEDYSEDKTPDGKMKTFLKQAGRLVKPATRIALAAGAGFVGEALGKAFEKGTEALAKEGEKALDPVWENESNRRNAMEGFKTALKDLTIENGSKDKPQKIVIIVDELDRCRPDFALNMLETIKHFFAVENVIFVLGVNLGELENSVKARYGAEIDAGKYLQKFIHIRYELPPKIGDYEKVDAWEVYYTKTATKLDLSKTLTDHLKRYLKSLPDSANLSLREIQRVLTVLALIPGSGVKGALNNKIWGWSAVIVGLATLKCFHPSLYKKARIGTLSYGEMVSVFAMLDTENQSFDQWENRVWAEIFDEPWDKEKFGTSKGPFGPFGLRGTDRFIQKISEEYLEAFEIMDPM